MYFRFSALTLALLLSLLTGCASLNSLESMAAGQQMRVTLLGEVVNDFHKSIYWGDVSGAEKVVAQEIRPKFLQTVINEKKREKLVNLEITEIEFGEENNTADVTVEISYYQIPSYVILKKVNKESWTFHRFEGGWTLISHETLVSGQIAESDSIS